MILAGDRLTHEPLPCNGVLVIGDPHVSSRRPGRRQDADWPGPILAKLRHCVSLANERDLRPVILGDLFDRPVETDLGLKSGLIRLLKEFRHRPLVNVGNHDMVHTTLSDGDSLALLALSDVVDVVSLSGPVAEFAIGGRRWGMGMTPYGQDIPRDLRGAFSSVERVAWFTHHDIAFGKAYPGAVPPFAIQGCALVVNGHVHRSEKAVVQGATRWENPGTINRLSVDLIDHAPSVWILSADGSLTAEPLPHRSDVFDLTGRLVTPAGGHVVAREVESAFVSLLKAESSTDLKKSDDGSLLRETLETAFVRERSSEAVRSVVRSLLEEAVERRASGR